MKLFFFTWLATFALAGTRVIPLPAARIPALLKKDCTFVHVWATWCTICIQEMPQVLKFLAATKVVHPVIIDVSDPMVQKNFSRQWMKNLAPPFAVYEKPPGDENKYLAVVEKYWTGSLPYSALYHKGKQKKVWLGELNLAEVKAEIPKLCR